MPSMRKASYSRGRTSRRSRKPKFFIARTTWAMLTSSWGSWSTTTMLMSQTHTVRNAECGVRSVKVGVARRTTLPCNSALRTPRSAFDSSHQLQYPELLRLLPVAPEPDPAIATAPHELAGAPHAVGEHFVNDKVEPHAPRAASGAPGESPAPRTRSGPPLA